VDAAEHLIGFVVYGVLHGAMWGTQLRPGRKIRWKSMGKSWEKQRRFGVILMTLEWRISTLWYQLS